LPYINDRWQVGHMHPYAFWRTSIIMYGLNLLGYSNSIVDCGLVYWSHYHYHCVLNTKHEWLGYCGWFTGIQGWRKQFYIGQANQSSLHNLQLSIINFNLFLWFTNDYWSGSCLVCLACSSTPALNKDLSIILLALLLS